MARTGWVFFIAAVVLSAAVVIHRPELRDPDSTLYAAMSSQLASRPGAEWLTPEWPPGRGKTGRFVEHTAISLWPGAVVEALGLPSGALVANLVAAMTLLWLIGRLARALAPESEATALAAWGLCLIAIQYWLRANHEVWWAAAVVGALLGVALRWPRWAVVGCTVAACAVKGPLGLDTALLVAPLAWHVHGWRWVLLFGVFAGLACVAFVGAYELAFRAVTGSSFVLEYLGIQLGYVEAEEATRTWLAKPRNIAVYLVKLAWFSLPGASLLAWGLWRRAAWKQAHVRMILLGIGLVVVATSLMSRQAGRYIFPAYPLLALAGALSVSGSRLSEWLAARARWVLLLVCVVALGRVVFARAVYRDVNLLPGTRVTYPDAGATNSTRTEVDSAGTP